MRVLNNRNLFSQSSGGQKLEINLSIGHAHSEGSREEPFLDSSVSGGSWCLLALGYITPISVCLWGAFSVSSLLSFVRTFVIEFRASPDNPG